MELHEMTGEEFAALSGNEINEAFKQLGRSVAVDFDGVLHPYTKGWIGSEPDDEPPVPGALEFMQRLLAEGFKVVIFSTRANHQPGEHGIIRWLHKYMRPIFYAMRDDKTVFITHVKPPAVAYVDDRAVMFVRDGGGAGNWDACIGHIYALANGAHQGAAAPPKDA